MEILTNALEYPNHAGPKSKIMPPCEVCFTVSDVGVDLPSIVGVRRPWSQAFVQRIFSVCGLLTEGGRNHLTKSLEIRVFLRLNAHIISGQ